MKKKDLEKFQVKMESVTRRWWFYLLFVLLQFIPPYTSKGYVKSEAGIIEILSHSLVFSYTALWPIFKIIPIILFIYLCFTTLNSSSKYITIGEPQIIGYVPINVNAQRLFYFLVSPSPQIHTSEIGISAC